MIVAVARTPFGKRGGGLAGLKGVELLRIAVLAAIARAGITPDMVEQIVGGCVTQAGEQSLNMVRNAWLSTGHDPGVGCTTVDVSCGSSQQANHLVAALIACGAIEIGVGCGAESMSRVPLGANLYQGPGHYKTRDYPWDDPPQAQFGGAERVARREGFSRADVDEYALLSQRRAASAVAAARFDAEIVPVTDPLTGDVVDHDEGVRDSTADGLAALRPVVDGGIHTAGNTSQISDGAAAIVWMSRTRAEQLGLVPRATLAHQVVTGADPYYLLDGPLAATDRILERGRMTLADIDRYEVNEAFAAVVLAWVAHRKPDVDRLNVNGGAISIGHPVGATGTRLLINALAELERTGGEHALVTMCCGGSQGTASLLRRI